MEFLRVDTQKQTQSVSRHLACGLGDHKGSSYIQYEETISKQPLTSNMRHEFETHTWHPVCENKLKMKVWHPSSETRFKTKVWHPVCEAVSKRTIDIQYVKPLQKTMLTLLTSDVCTNARNKILTSNMWSSFKHVSNVPKMFQRCLNSFQTSFEHASNSFTQRSQLFQTCLKNGFKPEPNNCKHCLKHV